MKKESVVLVVVAAALVAFGAGRLSKSVSTTPQAAPAAVAANAPAAAGAAAPEGAVGGIPASMPAKGAPDALVTILEVSDFQCPFCNRVGPTLKQLQEKYPKDVRIVWANQPLPFHDKAKGAAIAALAAHRQGKFWEMHDKLFANQQQLSDAQYKIWAKEIGLDVAKWEKDLADPALAAQVAREQAAANATGARGTPAFFINGKLLSGAQPFEQFDAAVTEALAEAKTVAAGGKTGVDLMQAIAEKRDATVGGKVVSYFLKGEAPAAAPAEPQQAQKQEEGPAVAPPDSFDIWKVPVDAKRDAVKGDSSKALVTIVEISDFECPFCSRAANTVAEVEKAYGDKVRLVFKHHPLPFHKNARPAHLASLAAAKQGKFWEFHDKAFANQQALTEENFAAWAKEIGLDTAKFDADRKDAALEKTIADDMEMAGGVGIRGTPGFFINGRKVVGAQPLGVFKAVIDEEIKKAEAAGKKGASYYDEIIAKGKVFSELGDTANDLNVEGLPFKGPKDAPVTITLFSDFQCPYCSRVAAPVEEFLKSPEYAGKVKVVFAHYPLSFHQMAKPAAVAAQEAFVQGGSEMFWKLHDALFAAQRELSEEKIKELAKAAGVDMAKLDAAIAAKTHDAIIEKAMAVGTKAGVEGTPSIYINGRKWEPQAGFSPEAFAKAAKLATTKK